jgi:P27 family predicted phage terminase small subunit
MRGRKPKAEHLKLLAGTNRKSRTNKNGPDPSKEGLQPPGWLPEDCHAWFSTIRDRISVFKLDSSSFTEAVAMVALRIRDIEACSEIIAREGRTYTTLSTTGQQVAKAHPAVNQRSEAMRHLQSLLSEFGLTPSSISKVGVVAGEEKEKDPWSKL